MTDPLLLPTEPVQPNRPKTLWFVVGGSIVALAILVSILIVTLTSKNSEFSDIQTACDPTGVRISVVDDGATLLVDSAGGTANSSADVEALICVLAQVNMPRAVVSQVDSTRALDGRQAASWEHYSASWTYHPDAGLDMIIQQN